MMSLNTRAQDMGYPILQVTNSNSLQTHLVQTHLVQTHQFHKLRTTARRLGRWPHALAEVQIVINCSWRRARALVVEGQVYNGSEGT
jgi:hypothetical protein